MTPPKPPFALHLLVHAHAPLLLSPPTARTCAFDCPPEVYRMPIVNTRLTETYGSWDNLASRSGGGSSAAHAARRRAPEMGHRRSVPSAFTLSHPNNSSAAGMALAARGCATSVAGRPAWRSPRPARLFNAASGFCAAQVDCRTRDCAPAERVAMPNSPLSALLALLQPRTEWMRRGIRVQVRAERCLQQRLVAAPAGAAVADGAPASVICG